MRRWRGQRQQTSRIHGDQHSLQIVERQLLFPRVQQSFANGTPQANHGAGFPHQKRQQSPRKAALAGQPRRRGGLQLLKLLFRPVLLTGPTAGHFLFEVLPGATQSRIFGVLGNLIVLFLPPMQLHVIFVSHRKHIPLIVKLRTTGAAKHLVGAARIDHRHPAPRALQQRRHHDGPGGKIDAGRQCLRTHTHGQQFLLKQALDSAAITWQQSGMVNPHTTNQNLFELPARSHAPVELVNLLLQLFLLSTGQQSSPLELLGHTPAFAAIKAEDQRRRVPCRLVFVVGHNLQLLGQQFVHHPAKRQWHTTFVTLQQSQRAVVLLIQPHDKLRRVADRRTDQQYACGFGQHSQREFPHDTPLGIVETMELVHHHGGDIVKRKLFRRQQPIEQNFGHHDQNRRVGIHPAIPGHQPHILPREPPAFCRVLQFVKLLFRQRDQRGGVVRAATGVQCLIEGRFRNHRFTGTRWRADQDAVFCFKPREDRLLLKRIGRPRKLIDIAERDFLGRQRFRGRSCF